MALQCDLVLWWCWSSLWIRNWFQFCFVNNDIIFFLTKKTKSEICDHPKNSFNNRTDLRRKEYDIGDSYTDEESQCFLCGSFKFSVTEIEAYMIC